MNISRDNQSQLIPLPQIPTKLYPTPIQRKEVLVVLMNMGGPRRNGDVSDFMKKLFSDRQLIRLPLGEAFQPLFARLMVLFRSGKAKCRYRLIGGGSPIFTATENQKTALREELFHRGYPDLEFAICFNYADPQPLMVIDYAIRKRKRYILPISMYPHFCKATTGSILFWLADVIRKRNARIYILPLFSYHLHSGYLQAIQDRILQQLKPGEALRDFYLLFSAHGVPEYLLREGDPYALYVSQTVTEVVKRLKGVGRWGLSYQSAVGPLHWTRPYTSQMIKKMARDGIRKIIVISISFVTDHIETLCEIDIEYRHLAWRHNICDFRMTKAVENHPSFICALADCVEASMKNNSGKQKSGVSVEAYGAIGGKRQCTV